MWSESDDEVIGGDLTAALAYLTPAGGAVVTLLLLGNGLMARQGLRRARALGRS